MLEVDVPAQAPIADLDEQLSALLRDGLRTVGITGVQVTFEAPERDRVAAWPSPTLNLFLYDLRESDHPRDRSWVRSSNPDGSPLTRSPLRLECSYAITAWTRNVLDEHRLLSQVLAVLLALPELPHKTAPITTRIGHARPEGRADFWSAIGSPYKASLEYAATVVVEPGVRRPSVQSVSGVGLGPADRLLTDPAHVVSQGGRVRGEAAAGAWVLLPRGGRSTVADETGRFVIAGIAPGKHEFRARSADGSEAAVTADVPGPPIELTLRR